MPRYQQYSLEQPRHLSKRTTLYALRAYQHANGQTPGTHGIVDAVATAGDSRNGTPSSARFVGMAGISVLV